MAAACIHSPQRVRGVHTYTQARGAKFVRSNTPRNNPDSRMALSVLSQGIAFVPGSAVPLQPSTRAAAASNIVAEEVRRAPLAHAHAEQSAAENTQGRRSGSEHALAAPEGAQHGCDQLA